MTTAPISSACPTCGTITKSGRMSCCGRGGSWFGDCGSAGNANVGHTWSEGIRACKVRQFQTVVRQQLRDPRPTMHGSRPTSHEIQTAALPNAYDADTTTSEAIAMASAMNTHDSSNMSTPTPILYRANPTITKATQSASTDMSMSTSSHASPSVSITVQEYEKLFHIFTYINLILIIVCLD